MDNLRLILFISGILVIAAIYAWEVFRERRANARFQRHEEPDVFDSTSSPQDRSTSSPQDRGIPNDPSSPGSGFPPPMDVSENKPATAIDTTTATDTQYWDRLANETDDRVALGDLDTLDNIDVEDKSGLSVAADDSSVTPVEKVVDPVDPLGGGDDATDTAAHFEEADGRRSFIEKFRIKKSRAGKDDIEKDHGGKEPPGKRLFITLTIIAKSDQRFGGREIREQFEKVDMRLGHMQVFHHFGMADQQTEQPVFSGADILEPGTFDPDHIDGHSTKGLALFMQLPGPLDGRVAFELMLNVAQQLAKSLDGDLCDDTRSTLTTQSANHLRERIEESKRKQLV